MKKALSFLALVFLAASLLNAQVSATAWPEADRLFHNDPLWLGADAAFSVDLGGGRVLWLFGDSFIAVRAGETRRQATFVRNSVAIETGYNPAQATIQFYSGLGAHGKAASFFDEDGKAWFWPMHGVRLGEKLLLFAMRETRDDRPKSLGFRAVGWNAFLIDNPDDAPYQWRMQRLEGPVARSGLLVGAAVVRRDGMIYAYAVDDETHDAYLVSWNENEARAGQLSGAQWWCGAERGWRKQPELREVVMHDASTELSVQPDPRGGWLEVQSEGFGATTVALRHAEQLEGPWSAALSVYTPPESAAAGAFVYAGKGHPELEGADVVATYAANGSDERVARDMTLYFPRFVRITLGAQPAHRTK